MTAEPDGAYAFLVASVALHILVNEASKTAPASCRGFGVLPHLAWNVVVGVVLLSCSRQWRCAPAASQARRHVRLDSVWARWPHVNNSKSLSCNAPSAELCTQPARVVAMSLSAMTAALKAPQKSSTHTGKNR